MKSLDALGNPIVLGQKYGYSTSASVKRVVVGEVLAVNGPKAQIKPVMVKEYMYDKPYDRNEHTEVFSKTAQKITVAGYLLFPVNS